MSYRRLWIALILTALISAFQPITADRPVKPKLDPADLKYVMLLKDIRAGMKGYGKSVFLGTTPTTFEVTILGILQRAYFGDDLILVKLHGGPMTSRGANLIEGMSGSPVYINGKVIGAFAFGLPFGKEPIGMVTPIEYMLDAWDPKLPTKPSSFYPLDTIGLDSPIAVDGHAYSKVRIDIGATNPSASDGDTMIFRPLATPLLVSGMSERVMARLRESLKPLNIVPIAGPGVASDKQNLHIDIQPGSAVGCAFVTGDLDMTGIGTVTYRRGDQILAFGHPMFSNPLMNGLGPINAPLMTAYIYDVYPSVMVSQKIAAPIKAIGTVFQDRPWAIGAKLGAVPTDMIPVSVHLNDQARGLSRNFNVKVVNNPLLVGSFAVNAVSEAIFEMKGTPSDVTARLAFEVVADEVGTIKRENVFFDPIGIDGSAVGELNQIITMLQFNPFHPVNVKRINVTLSMMPRHSTARLEKIFLREGKFKPGDTVEVGAILRPFTGNRITKTIKLKLPASTPNGHLTIEVTGGPPRLLMSSSDSAEPGSAPPTAQATPGGIENLQQLVKKFLERNRNDELVGRIVLPRTVPSISGEKFTDLPPTMADAMKSSKVSLFGTEREEIKTAVPCDWVVFGTQRLTITVQKEEKSEKRSAAKKSSDSSSSSTADSSSSDSQSTDDSSDTTSLDGSLDSPEAMTSVVDSSKPPAKPEPPATPVPPTASEDSTTPDWTMAPDDTSTEETTVEAPKPSSEPATGSNEKPVGRQPSTWRQTGRTDFLGGTFKNTAATTGDLLTLAGSLKPLCDVGEAYVWCVQPDGKGNAFVGTGNKGVIYKVTADGTASVFYDSPELEIQSLAMDSAGNLYAGTSPNGVICKVAPDGKAGVLFNAPEKYIVGLALDGKGNLYAATGDKCKVYRISPDGRPDTVLDSSENYALSLAVDKDDNVYVGTGSNGIVYKIAPKGIPTVLYDADEESVTALAVDPQAVVYAGTSPKGIIYKIGPGATPKVIYDKADKGVLGLAADGGNVYATSATTVFRVTPDEKVCTLGNERDLQFMSIAAGGGRLYTGTGNVGSVYTAEIGSTTQGTFESTVHDCTLPAKWGRIEWEADTQKGASVTLQTRTGAVAEPDSSWSPWSPPYTESGASISSPSGRYIQYMAALKTDDAAAAPKLSQVSIIYMPRNQAPKVTLTAPKGGEKWAGKQAIRWSGSDPDKDTLDYKVYSSADNGATWQQIADKVQKPSPPKLEKPKPESDTGKPKPASIEMSREAGDPDRMLAEMAAELDKHPEIPQDVKDKIMAEAPAAIATEIKGAGDSTASKDSSASSTSEEKPPANGTKQTSLSWDTAKVKDGRYLVKVIGSDLLSNAVDAMTGESVSESLTVCNKKPRVVAFKKTLTVQADKSLKLEGFASQELIGIAGVQYRIGGSEWASAAPTDGMFDSGFESFTVTTQPLTKGEYTVEIKAIDQAGNSTTIKLPAKVE